MSGQPDPDHFRVHEWEIWYVYSCYLTGNIPDLRVAASRLLRNGFGRLVSLPDGLCAWRHGSTVVCKNLDQEDTLRAGRTKVGFPEDLPVALRKQALVASAFRSAERHLFGASSPLPEAYARIFLPFLRLGVKGAFTIDLEVFVQLFSSGIVTISFRGGVKNEDLDLSRFINLHVNLSEMPLAFAESELELSRLCMHAEISGRAGFWRRRKVLRLRRQLESWLATQSVKGEETNEFRIHIEGGPSSQLSGVALEYVKGLAYALGHRRNGVAFLLLGEQQRLKWEGFWHGSPHIHLLGFSDQGESAKEIELRHGSSLKWILSRTAPSVGNGLSADLPENPRAFDDYAVYINEAAVLWVSTTRDQREGLTEGEGFYFSFPRHHHQIKGELLEYGYILYRSLMDELTARNLDWGKLLSIKERQVMFEVDLSEVGQFGEIRRMLRVGLEARGIDELRKGTEALFSLRQSNAEVGESRMLTATAIGLGLIVSILGLPGFLDSLQKPLGWSLLRLGFVRVGDATELVIRVAVAAIIIGIPAAFVIWWFRRRHWVYWPRRIDRG